LNCIEKLRNFSCSCGSSHDDLKIMDFEELPEDEKFNFDYYESDKDFIVFCEKCLVYEILADENTWTI
jgi:hypothetical protein